MINQESWGQPIFGPRDPLIFLGKMPDSRGSKTNGWLFGCFYFCNLLNKLINVNNSFFSLFFVFRSVELLLVGIGLLQKSRRCDRSFSRSFVAMDISAKNTSIHSGFPIAIFDCQRVNNMTLFANGTPNPSKSHGFNDHVPSFSL